MSNPDTTAKPLVWRAVETAPEHPTDPYLAIDSLGNIQVTLHDRATLMNVGWAEGWHPMKGEIEQRTERFRDALDEIKRHCGENGETGADRGGRWAAQIATDALEAKNNVH